MEDGDTEKYHISSLIQDVVFSSRKMGCIRCISSQLYNNLMYYTPLIFILLTYSIPVISMYLQFERKTVWILIRWLHQKPADLDLVFS